jgi:hypothetical protein
MSIACLVSSLDVDVHLLLCDFGRSGVAYVETDLQRLMPPRSCETCSGVNMSASTGSRAECRQRLGAGCLRAYRSQGVQEIAQREGWDLTSGTQAVRRRIGPQWPQM